MRRAVSINDLAMRLAAKDVHGALALLPVGTVKDALSPAGTITRDATMRGRRAGVELIKRASQ